MAGRMNPRGVPGPGGARPEAVSQDKELHQRAREALGLGGVTAGEAIYVIFKSTFVQLPGEKWEITLDKLQARLAAYQVLGKIGTVLKNHEMTENGKKFNPVRRLLTETGDKINKRFEDTSVFDADRRILCSLTKVMEARDSRGKEAKMQEFRASWRDGNRECRTGQRAPPCCGRRRAH